MITAGDVEAIERATLRALPPRVLEVDDGWLLCANDGVVSRANSVLPLAAGADAVEAKLDRAIAFYRRQSLTPAFRVSPFSRPKGLTDALAARGFTPDMTTLVMTMPTEAREPSVRVALTATPDASWRALFIAPGVSDAEAGLRLATLSRGQDTRFANLQIDGETVAIGAASLSDGWVGVHGMRTLAVRRGRGYGAAVLARLLADARERGAARAFLQVEQDNTGAVRLYARLGFQTVYAYDYWRRP
ncbi:MAG TPA: GNAT family N-acetyltransferase [Caulobacteraceae bacterium]